MPGSSPMMPAGSSMVRAWTGIRYCSTSRTVCSAVTARMSAAPVALTRSTYSQWPSLISARNLLVCRVVDGFICRFKMSALCTVFMPALFLIVGTIFSLPGAPRFFRQGLVHNGVIGLVAKLAVYGVFQFQRRRDAKPAVGFDKYRAA